MSSLTAPSGRTEREQKLGERRETVRCCARRRGEGCGGATENILIICLHFEG